MVKNLLCNARDMGIIPDLEDPTCLEQLSPCATNTEPVLWSPRAASTELTHLEPVLCNKRSHRNEKPAHNDEE